MSNLIDRDKLIEFPHSEGSGTNEQIIDWIGEVCEKETVIDHEDELVELCWKVIDGFINVVKTEPTVNEWIPVSERLPKEGEDVFAVIGDEEQYGIDKATYICEGVWLKDMLRFDPNEDVLAWMPILTYKENNNETNRCRCNA